MCLTGVLGILAVKVIIVTENSTILLNYCLFLVLNIPYTFRDGGEDRRKLSLVSSSSEDESIDVRKKSKRAEHSSREVGKKRYL